VVDFSQVIISKVQSASWTHALLDLQELGLRASQKGVSSQALTPIDHIPIVRTGSSTDFVVSLDVHVVVPPEFSETFSVLGVLLESKDRSFLLLSMPVFVNNPVDSFVVVSPFRPCHQLYMHVVVACLEGVLGADCSMVETPSFDDRVEFVNDGLLWSRPELGDPVAHVLEVCFDGSFTWFDEGFLSEWFASRIFPSVCSPDRELSDRLSHEVKTDISLDGSQGVCDSGFLWMEDQSHIRKPYRDLSGGFFEFLLF
jgi:hypothetical protein